MRHWDKWQDCRASSCCSLHCYMLPNQPDHSYHTCHGLNISWITYFMLYPDLPDDLEQSTSETNSVMCGIHLCEAKECAKILPVIQWDLFIPVTCDRKVGILISCLPCITGEWDKTSLIFLWMDLSKVRMGKQRSLTLIHCHRFIRFFLNNLIIYVRVAFVVGITTPHWTCLKACAWVNVGWE